MTHEETVNFFISEFCRKTELEICEHAYSEFTSRCEVIHQSLSSSKEKSEYLTNELRRVQKEFGESHPQVRPFVAQHLQLINNSVALTKTKKLSDVTGFDIHLGLTEITARFMEINYHTAMKILMSKENGVSLLNKFSMRDLIAKLNLNVELYDQFKGSFARIGYYKHLRIELEQLGQKPGLTHREQIIKHETLVRLGQAKDLSAKELKEISPKRYQAKISLKNKPATMKELDNVRLTLLDNHLALTAIDKLVEGTKK